MQKIHAVGSPIHYYQLYILDVHPLIVRNITYYCMTSSHLIKILQSDWSVAMQ